MSTPFARFLRDARNDRRLSQLQVSKQTKIPQTTISAWEGGRQEPDESDGRLEKLAAVLDVRFDELRDALRRRAPASTDIPVLADEGYIAVQQAYVEPLGSDVEIWLFGPATLPVTRSPAFRDVWLSNLENGINYYIVWIASVVVPRTLVRLAPVLRGIGEELQSRNMDEDREVCGSIYHLPLGSHENDSFWHEYQSLKKEGLPHNSFGEPVDGGEPPSKNEVVRKALFYSTPFASFTLCKPRRKAHQPLLAMALREYSSFHGGPSAPGFVILSVDDAWELYELADKITTLFKF